MWTAGTRNDTMNDNTTTTFEPETVLWGTPEVEHGYLGRFDGRQVAALGEELRRQKESKRDYRVETPALAVSIDANGRYGLRMGDERGKSFRVGDQTFLSWDDAEQHADTRGGTIDVVDAPAFQRMTKTAVSQLHVMTHVPTKFSRWAIGAGHGDVVAEAFNTILERDIEPDPKRSQPSRRFVRTMDGNVRAILSASYKPMIDNADLFFRVVESFDGVNAEFWKARLRDDHFEIMGVRSGIAAEVRTDRVFDPGDGWMSRWHGKRDVHSPAVDVSHSETGRGGLSVKIAHLRRVCQNFCVWGDVVRSVHIGRRVEGTGIVFEDDTMRADAKAAALKVRDAINAAFDEERFNREIELLNNATQVPIEAPVHKAVEQISDNWSGWAADEGKRSAIIERLIQSCDRSQYGLIQAVTEEAHQHDFSDPDAAAALETMGADLAKLSAKKFTELVAV